MTREEHIYEASKAYSEYEYNQTGYENGFINGAKWADNHPVNVWHDASEEPKEKSRIAIVDKRGEWWVRNYVSDDFDARGLYGWKCCIAYYDLKIWAYTDDLLPKGGEK